MIRIDYYLNKIIDKMWNGNIKVNTGIRQSGKLILLFNLFKDYLLQQGVEKVNTGIRQSGKLILLFNLFKDYLLQQVVS